jgi:hypothetical protein
MRRAISVTIEEDNLLWLKGQAAGTSRGSISAVLDRLVTEARTQGASMSIMMSVAGTIDLPPDDPDLEAASAYVGETFDRSLRRPMLVKEGPPKQKRRVRRRG